MPAVTGRPLAAENGGCRASGEFLPGLRRRADLCRLWPQAEVLPEACKSIAKRQRRFGAFRGAFRGDAGAATTTLPAAVGRALAAVKRAEDRLVEARAVRAALEPPPAEPADRHYFATYQSFEECRVARGGGVFSPGPDTSEMADRIVSDWLRSR